MAEPIVTDVDDEVLQNLREPALRYGRTLPDEAKAILVEALRGEGGRHAWAPVDEIYQRLAASGRTFSDSADLIREDRDR